MTVLEWITAIILAVGFVMSGAMKLSGQKMALEMAEKLGVGNLRMLIGGAEVLGGIGVIIGAAVSDLEWLGVLAAIGLIALMIGAVVYHQRAGDKPKDMMPAGVMLVLAVVYIIALFAN